MKSVIYLWHNRALIFGVPADTAPHSHYALQLSIGLDKKFALRSGNNQKPETMRAALIAANARHIFDGAGGTVVNLYLDPESRQAREITNKFPFKSHLEIEAGHIKPFLPHLRKGLAESLNCAEAFSLTEDLLENLFQTQKAETPLDSRIGLALEILKNAPDNLISADAVARKVCLSPGRFAHLFRAETGLPVRRYLLWMRLRRALRMLGENDSLTTAAHAAGFADSAHLTRTFRQMFGLAPSEIFQNSRFVQVRFCDE
jgi:AraC-like DNA-binding protein